MLPFYSFPYFSQNCLWLIVAYCVGSFPTALVLSKLFKKGDVRLQGSGNIGATNAVRTMGKTLGFFTFLIDALKGVCVLGVYLSMHLSAPFSDSLLLSLFVILGHIFSIYLLLFSPHPQKGGKGIATTFGLILSLSPPLAALLLLTSLMFYMALRNVGIANVLTMLLMPLYVYFFDTILFLEEPDMWMKFSIVLSVMIIYAHRSNLKAYKDAIERS